MSAFNELAIARFHRSFLRTFRAYFAKPETMTSAHDEQLYWLARSLAHEGRIVLGESR